MPRKTESTTAPGPLKAIAPPSRVLTVLFSNVEPVIVTGAVAWVVSIAPARQAALGFLLMGLAAALNVAVNLWLAPQFLLCTLPLALLAMGSGLLMPIVTILVLDTAPERRGTASSLQGCIGSIFNGLVAGVLSPAVMHLRLGLALASALLWALGAMAWRLAQHHSLKS